VCSESEDGSHDEDNTQTPVRCSTDVANSGCRSIRMDWFITALHVQGNDDLCVAGQFFQSILVSVSPHDVPGDQ
jgi:hypothetical protein